MNAVNQYYAPDVPPTQIDMLPAANVSPMDAKPAPNSADWVEWTDCRPAMRRLADGSVSLVLTDPPYFIDGMDDDWDHARLRSRVKPGVIGGLPAGMKFDRAQGRNLYNFLLPIAGEWARLLKPGGFALCFSQPRLIHHTAMALEDAGFEIRDMLAWRYEGQPKAFKQEHFVRRKRHLPRLVFPNAAPDQQVRHLIRDGWNVENIGNGYHRLNDPRRPSATFTTDRTRRQGRLSAQSFDELKAVYGNCCASCGSAEGAINPRYGEGAEAQRDS